MERYITTFGIKSCIFICLLSFGYDFAVGQITIGQADMPKPGDTIRLSTCNSNAGLPSPTLTGTNYVWDYSKLVPFTQTVDTFLSVTSTPLAYQFFFNDPILYPAYKSTVAQAAPNLPPLGIVTITNVINYYKDQSSNYESVGYGANINSVPTSVKDDTIDIMYVFPANYGNSDSCHSSNHAAISGLGYYSSHQKRINHVDGWGTLITPYGSFNALRITTLLYSYDSLNIDTPIHIGFSTPVTGQIQYKWFGNGYGLPLLQVNEQIIGSNPVFTSAVYRDSVRKPVLGISPTSRQDIKILAYPNPSDGNIIIQENNSSNMGVEVFNIGGQMVYNKEFIVLHQNAPLNVNLTGQPSGIYFYKVTNENGEALGEGKLIISK